jgi:protein SCO1/2
MTVQTSRVLLVAAAFLVGLVLCLGVALVLNNRAGTASAGASVGGPFALVDQDGHAVTDRDMAGHPFLVFFGFTHCPDVCPTALFEMSEIYGKLGRDGDRLGGLFITVDPERDTPAALKDYLSSFDPHLRGLTGDPAAIAATLKAYRVYAKKVPLEGGDYTMDHTAIVYLMDREGHFVAPFNLKRTPEDAATELRKYL